ncbi:MAG: amino acid ABC transporter ATP-binding protein, partial [Spirochaetaceae bacterium]|nr:amino acid ABC transporter ATP-binding protein [Spirochaetaceae bacterium]
IGPSGTGKSTLLRCINGLESLDSGDIFVNGLSVRVKKNLQKIRMDCGMVFQQTVLFPHLDVMGNMILSPMKLLNMKRDEAEEKARTMLKRVGLENKEKSRHNELSGGEQQRVAIARALMMDPQALLLDEITSALDPEMSQEVLHILENLAADGVCMIVVTHEMTFARHVASRILFLEGGKLICDKSKEQFFLEERQTNDRVKRFLQFIGETEDGE